MDDNTPDHPEDPDVMPRADALTGIVFFVLGLVIAYLSWTMPRLEMRGIHPATVPGLVPGLLGAALALCGALLATRAFSLLRGRPGWGRFVTRFANHETGRLAVAACLALVYALILVGMVPFWLATGLFVFVFILTFEIWLSDAPRPLVQAALWAALEAVIVAAAVTLVFERGFLVRLP